MPHKKSRWSQINEDGVHKLRKQFVFPDFVTAFSFIAQVALISQELDHHAEIYNCYNKVTLTLSTHTAKTVTKKDHDMVKRIEKLRLA